MELLTFDEHIKKLWQGVIWLIIIFISLEIISIGFSTSILKFISEKFSLISIEPLDIFNSSMLIATVITILIVYPIAFWMIYKYLKPAFTNIQPIVKLFFISSSLFYTGFLFGAIFFSGFLLFLAKQFSLSMGITLLWGVSSVVKLIFLNGIIFAFMFQLPLLVYFGLKTKLFDRKKIVKNSWIAFPLILFISGWVTPPDPISVFLMAIPLCILFYASLFICFKLTKTKQVN